MRKEIKERSGGDFPSAEASELTFMIPGVSWIPPTSLPGRVPITAQTGVRLVQRGKVECLCHDLKQGRVACAASQEKRISHSRAWGSQFGIQWERGQLGTLREDR